MPRIPGLRRSFRFPSRDAAQIATDVDDELRFHLEMRATELARSGLAPEAALAEARREFGDLEFTRQYCRDIDRRGEQEERRMELWNDLRLDVRFGARALRKNAGFTSIAILALALGIGANTAIFSVLDAVLLRPLPYAGAERLVVLWNSYGNLGLTRAALSPAEFADYQAQRAIFAELTAFADRGVSLTGRGEPARLQAFVVSPNFFRVLGASPARGRGFVDEEGEEGRNRVAVLSDDLWRTRFAGDPGIIGQSIRLNGEPYTVVGIAPPGVRFPDAASLLFPERADLWLPFAWEQRREEPRGDQWLRIVARLGPGTTVERAQRDLDVLATTLRRDYESLYRESTGWRPVLVPLREQIVGDVRPALLVLFGAVGLVLLIACANVANLTLARATARQREVAVRTALGASRSRILRQLLTESLLLALGGGAVGLLVGTWGTEVLVRLGPTDVPGLDRASVDGRVLAFTLAATMLTGLLFGLAPAVQQTRPNLTTALKEGGRGSTEGKGRRSARTALVVAEIALAAFVLVGAGLLLRSFVRLQSVDPGFAGAEVMTFKLNLPASKYDDGVKIRAFYGTLFERLAAVPGVRSVAVVQPLPLSGDAWSGSFAVEGQPVGPSDPFPHGEYAVVTPDYFAAMSIPLRAGRTFGAQDITGAPAVAIVDEKLAERYWPRADAVGKRINLGGDADSVWTTVVGVVGHVHNAGPQAPGEPQIYLPVSQRAYNTMSVVVRGRGDPLPLASPVRDAIHAIDPELAVAKLRPMEEMVAASVSRERFSFLLLSTFAAAAVLLAAVGLYGVMSYMVAQRTQEIGVRTALGARPADIVGLIVGRGLRVTLAGLAVGLLAAAAGTRLLANMLFGVSAQDPLTFAGVAVVLSAVALVACLVPARRAMRVDPVVALRAG